MTRIHYSADVAKRPGTVEGDEWLRKASAAYPGGTLSPRWRKEMEIDWGALGGTRLFPRWEEWIAAGKIVTAPFVATGYRIFASYDHGWRNPLAYHVHGIDSDGNIATLWELYGSGIGVPFASKIILGEDVVLPDGRRFEGNPYAGQESLKIADPSMFANDQPMNDGTNKSIADLFRRHGVHFVKGERGGDSMVAEWLHGHFWKDPEKPLYRVTCPFELNPGTKPSGARSGSGAPWLVWEIGQQRHKDFSARVALHRDQPEELVDKDNHAWDGLKMFLKRFPPRAMAARAEDRGGSFDWWAKISKVRDGSMVRETFRIS